MQSTFFLVLFSSLSRKGRAPARKQSQFVRCVKNGKPIVESKTLIARCNSIWHKVDGSEELITLDKLDGRSKIKFYGFKIASEWTFPSKELHAIAAHLSYTLSLSFEKFLSLRKVELHTTSTVEARFVCNRRRLTGAGIKIHCIRTMYCRCR